MILKSIYALIRRNLKFGGRICNFKESIWSNQGLNCINIEVWLVIKDLIEEIQNQWPNRKGMWMQGFKLIKSGVKLKKLEVCWLIKGQNAQFHNQESKWNMRSTLRLIIEFDKGEIAWH